MAQGTSFSTKGATPNGLGSRLGQPNGISINSLSSPKSSALNNMLNGTGGGQNQSRIPTPAPVQHQSLTAPTNQPIKNQTVKSADGTVTTQTYHVPEATTPTTPEKPSAFGSAVGGLLDTQKTAQDVASPFQGMLAGKAATATPEVSQATTGLLNRQQELSPEVQKANAEYSQFAKANPMMSSDVRNNPNVASEVSVGRGRALGETLAGQQHALADTVTNALAGQGQQITAGTNAGTLANTQSQQQITAANNAAANALEGQSQGITSGQQAGLLAKPIGYAYGTEQVINPMTGESVAGGAGTSISGAVNDIATKVKEGTMSYNDALNALSGYGQAGINALQSALPQGFNIAQSNALAGQQGTIAPNLQYANAALENLKNSMSDLKVWGQGSNIPIIGGIANWFSRETGIGKEQTSTKAGAVGEAQQAIASVLASIKGGTPTDYGSQARALLPDDPTPADIDAAQANLKALGEKKQSIYGNPGQSTTQSSGGSTDGIIQTKYGPINKSL